MGYKNNMFVNSSLKIIHSSQNSLNSQYKRNIRSSPQFNLYERFQGSHLRYKYININLKIKLNNDKVSKININSINYNNNNRLKIRNFSSGLSKMNYKNKNNTNNNDNNNENNEKSLGIIEKLESIDDIKKWINKPTWSVCESLLGEKFKEPIDFNDEVFYRLINLSGLPKPSVEDAENDIKDLKSQIAFIERIQEINTDNVEPLCILEDEIEPELKLEDIIDEDREVNIEKWDPSLLSQNMRDGYYVVKK